MAVVAVQIAVELLKGVTPLIKPEISLISGLSEDVRAIKEKLESISAYLESEEEKSIRDVGKKVWLRQVRTLAYDIEDVIEEYHLLFKARTMGRLKEYLLLRVRNMAKTIKDILKRCCEISKDNNVFNRFNNNDVVLKTSYSTQYTQTITVVKKSELVGIGTSRREVMQLLESNKMVVVVGMRGIGKTTVVRCIYDDPRVIDNFSIWAWISARRTHGSEEILRSMMKQFYEAEKYRCLQINGASAVANDFQIYATESNYIQNIDSMSRNSLQDIVRRYLKDKRYFIVFDNVKDGYLEKATCVNCLLSISNNNDSKILVTTRNQNVAHAWVDGSSQSIYKLRPLTHEKALKLFCRKTFQSRSCPPSLHELTTGIVQRCEGLPPAILAMACLLYTKVDDSNEWQKVYNSLGFYLENHQLTGIYEILVNNYNDLPYNLQPCFLYFGLFPKGYPIHVMKLIRLWIAEGFIIKDGNNITLEEIAQENMNKLISMSLVEVKDRDPTERPKTLHIHEFLHEIILSKLHELSFCLILSGKYSTTDEHPRRLSIHKDHKLGACEYLHGISNYKSHIRSLFLFEPSQDISSIVLHTKFLKCVYLLKVLDLCNAPIDDISRKVGKLRNLRYLSIRNTNVRTLPKTIGKLQYLQTLDLKQTSIVELPYEITKLHELRHLLSYSYEPEFSLRSHIQKIKGIKLLEGSLENLVDLQKLAYIDMSHGTYVMTDLKKLRQLRRLGIIGLKQEHGKYLCDAIEVMIFLQTLDIYSIDKNQIIDLNHFQSPPTTLKRLYLNGPLGSCPKWILELHNLVKLYLRWSSICDFKSLENLHVLPNLVELHLLEACNGILLEFKNKGFKRLKILHLLDLHDLESLLIHEGALSLLEELSIGESPQLEVPLGM